MKLPVVDTLKVSMQAPNISVCGTLSIIPINQVVLCDAFVSSLQASEYLIHAMHWTGRLGGRSVTASSLRVLTLQLKIETISAVCVLQGNYEEIRASF